MPAPGAAGALGITACAIGGAWDTTAANLWGGLALEQFSKTRESEPVSGATQAVLGDARAQVDWTKVTRLKAGDLAAAPSAYGAPAQPGQFTGNSMLLQWPAKAGEKQPLIVTHSGSGKPWLTLQSLAAVELKAPFAAGYQIKRTVTPVEQADKSLPAGQYSRGDVLRVTLDITGAADMTWVAVSDPVPGGATILGSGLGRDSAIAKLGEKIGGGVQPIYEERSFEAFRAYYQYLPKGSAQVEYTVRLNNPGTFQLPPTRVEALYAPEMFGESPNARVSIK